MKRTSLLFLLICVLSFAGLTQERKAGLVPINTPWLFAGSLRPSLHLKATKNSDWLVVTYIRGLNQEDGWRSGENGYNFEYRLNFHRDSNLSFNSYSYLGVYYARTTNRNDLEFFDDYRRSSLGILFATTFELNSSMFLEIFFGAGNGNESSIDTDQNSFPYSYNYLDITGGLNFGFRL